MRKIYIVTLGSCLAALIQSCGLNSKNPSISLPFSEDIIPVCNEFTPENFAPEVSYEYSQHLEFPEWNQVMSSPVVGDLNGDKISEIVYTSFRRGNGFHYNSMYGVLRVIDGKTKKVLFHIGDPEIAPVPAATPLIVDIDNDGKGEIFYLHHSKTKMVSLNFDGSLRWIHETGVTESYPYGGYATSDLNADGFADIIGHGVVVSETLVDEIQTVSQKPYKNISSGTVATVSLLVTTIDDNSSNPQIIDNTGVYDYSEDTFTKRFSPEGANCNLRCFPAAADIDKNTPGKEIIFTGSGSFKIYSNQGTVLSDIDLAVQNPEDICANRGGVGGGQASIGNFDSNEETIEIAIATGKSLTIYDSSGQKQAGSTTRDCSSRATGVTSFDFNGDGTPEILYSDELKFRVYTNDGTSELKIIYELDNPSGTLLEYPIVADVTGDWKPEIIIVSNNYAWGEFTGLRILSNPLEDKHWMPSSGVWNQQSYVAGDINENLQINTDFLSKAKKLASSNFKINSSGYDISCKESSQIEESL